MKRIKRFVSIIAIFSLCFSIVPTVHASNTHEYHIVNLEDGTSQDIVIPESTDDGASFSPSSISTRSIIGDTDDRIPISGDALNYYPTSAVGVIYAEYTDGTSGRGTGWLFGPNDVATAAHVLYNKDGYIADYVEFSIGGSTYVGTNLAVPGEFMNGRNVNYDYACFELSSNVGNTRGYFGWTQNFSVGDSITVIGRPGDYSLNVFAIAFGTVLSSTTSYLISHNADTLNGMSGSPVFKGNGTGGDAYAIGIHRGGGDSYNTATRITSTIAGLFAYYRAN